MGLANSLNRTLSEPSSRERDLLQVELGDGPSDESNQTTFMNHLTSDIDAKVTTVEKNTDQKLIIVTQDKTLLCLKRNLARLGKKEWVAPLSTVLTLLISLITADFKATLGLSSAEWRAIFIVSAFIATGWLSYALHKAMNAKTFHEVVRDVIYELAARKKFVDERSLQK